MSRPTTKAELLATAEAEFDRLWTAVDSVPVAAREIPGACEEWSVKDLLAHLLVWQQMTLEWERVGSSGAMPEIPAPGYSFTETPALNEVIYTEHQADPWAAVVAGLRASHEQTLTVIDGYGDDLFAKAQYPWTRSTSVGAYFVSATSSHYAWASKLIRKWVKAGSAK